MAPPPPLSWAMAPPYHYQGPPLPQPQQQQQQPAAPAAEDGPGAGGDDARSLWIGALLDWMDEDYLCSCFSRSPELASVVIKRNKQTGKSYGFGYLNFNDHTAADQILQSYNGQKMPNANRNFKLHWVTKVTPDSNSDHAIYVGGLAFDVTDFMLHHIFKSRYPSVKAAKVVWDWSTGHSKHYGFVLFGDAKEHAQAMTEMNGAYCSTRPMRIGPAPNKKIFYTRGADSYCDPNNSRLIVRDLDLSVTDDDLMKAFSPYGELVNVKVIVGKHCGFVTYSSRASAEEAMSMLNGSQLGDTTIRVSWSRRPSNKQDQWNGGFHGQPQCSGADYGWCPQDTSLHGYTGHPGYAYYQQQRPQQAPVQ